MADGKGRGGARQGAGRPVKVSAGEGERHKTTVSYGEELLTLLRQRYPTLTEQDAIRAAMWEAVGRPQQPAVPIEGCV